MEINFIPDEVLKLTKDNDLLGTKPYSDTIFEVVKKCSGKKNIGLFGSWGSGKSTILATFEKLIEDFNEKKDSKGNDINSNNRIAYFEFDAWKYSQDDFRRSFLIELTRKYQITYGKRLQKLLYSESTVEDPERRTYKLNKFSLSSWVILILVVFGLTFYYWPVLDLYKDVKVIVSMLALVISLLSTAAKHTVNKYKVVVKENKVVEPERFEMIFDGVISELTSKKPKSNIVYEWIQKLKKQPKYEKVVIVIDNLDRCDDENVLVTLNTIKNFLEHDKVIYILPVDEKGISAFLSDKTDNADEYLRKIFHLIIRLKEFSKKELLEFTKKIDQTYSLNLNSSSIRIICSEFTSNPRKIIQFLNNYQSEIKLIEQQSRIGYINEEFIKTNITFFIKILIVKYEWKSLYDEVLYDKSLLNKINKVITNLQPDDDGFYSIDRSNVKLNDTQRNFFFSTQEIHCAKIDPFILNVDLDRDIPDDVTDFIREGRYKELANYLIDDKKEFSAEQLLLKINEVYSNLTFKHNDYSFIALPILKLLIEFVLDEEQEVFRDVLVENHKEYTFLKSLFKNPGVSKLFEKFDFEKLTKTTKWMLDNVCEDLFNSYIDYYKSTLFAPGNTIEDEKEKIKVYFDVFKNSQQLGEVKQLFSKKLIGKTHLASIEILDNYSIASKVITTSTYKRLAKTLTDLVGKIDSNSNHIFNLCFEYVQRNEKDKLTVKSLVNYLIEEIQNFYTIESIGKGTYIDYQDYFQRINKLFRENIDIELSTEFINTLDSINSYFYTNYDSSFDEEKNFDLYKSFFVCVKNLILYTKDFNKVGYRTEFFGRYLDENHSRKITLCLNDILFEDVKKHSAYKYPFTDTLIKFYTEKGKKSLPFGKTLMLMLERSISSNEGLSQAQKKQIIIRTINIFSAYKTSEYFEYMNCLKRFEKRLFLETLNQSSEISYHNYVKSVKLLNDEWFYGDAINNYISYPLLVRGTHSNFLSRVRDVSYIFSEDEQREFLKDLIENFSDKVYKWLRTTHKFLSKRVYDIYLENLVIAHQNKIIGHNDFFEWIIQIPKGIFYKKRKDEFIKYLKSLEIKHKTYAPKKDKALNYLSD